MNMLDKFLGFDLFEDLTETTWWADTVFRGLEKRGSDKQESDFEAADDTTQRSTELQ
jgi:hypothetical protein